MKKKNPFSGEEELVSELIQYLEMQYEHTHMIIEDELVFKAWISWTIKQLEEIK